MTSSLGCLVAQCTLDVLKHVGLGMLAVHLIEHHLDVFPLSNLVKAVSRVMVNSASGSLVGEEGEK